MNIESLYQLFKETSGACTDTRNIATNSMFFALKGGNFNANEFAKEALLKGSKYAVVDDPKVAGDQHIILVENVLQTLQQLANYHRMQFTIPVIGLTGSNGKTTTKELITQVLNKKYKVHSTKGNFNNHIGVPLTLLSMPSDTEIAIIEMGANGPNDIAELCEIASPNYGLITNIGKAHLEGFGGFEGVIKAKGQLYDFLRNNGGKLFLHVDDVVLGKMHNGIPAFTYSTQGDSADVNGRIGPASLLLSFYWSNGNYQSNQVQTNLTGTYNLPNLIAAVAIGCFFDVPPECISSALAEYQPDNNRSQVQKSGSNTLILDAYNANPTSTDKALRSFAKIDVPNKFFILGDMLELGASSIEEHETIVKTANELNLKGTFVGKQYGDALANLPIEYTHFETAVDAIPYLKSLSLEDTLILIKGSRGIKLETVISEL